MSQSFPQTLPSLSQREAIADALFRAAIGSDHHDSELFLSAWAGEDVSMEIHDDNKRVMQGLTLIRTNVLDKVGPMDTTHNISMVRVNYQDGADTASLTATSMAQHAPSGTGRDPNGTKYTVGGEYSVDLIKDEAGVWRIKKLVLSVIWTSGDASLMRPPQK
ncbi:hypothetical protein V495_04880 [Pseudogymnoascus sp. VKM F-4514 (FW-929)]|nr:hypothetical protein V490_03966 [Pseudogymnoascus sp. VKM F-3557]KFY41582.1 hypothetical protein V495_04880 [Pseudogymnoascus sp. VKM F-4514 (FW-929)]KFY61066.1 hypothetical protein V497_03192 [Pseudogymnoascus sp. VKM F-4516 (FW-969)]